MEQKNDDFNQVVSDLSEFVDCATRCVLPHNVLLYDIIMNAFEMMVMRSERESDVFEGFILAKNERNSYNDNCNGCSDGFDADKLSDEDKKEIDDIVASVKMELGE